MTEKYRKMPQILEKKMLQIGLLLIYGKVRRLCWDKLNKSNLGILSAVPKNENAMPSVLTRPNTIR